MSEIIYGNDGIPADEFRPERPSMHDSSGKVLMSIPTNSSISGFIEPVEESADIFRGKTFSYVSGPNIGLKVRAVKMLKEGNNYFVIFDNEQKMSVQDVQRFLVEVDILPDDINLIRPNMMNNNMGNEFDRPIKKIVPFDPVMEILKKRKKKPTKVNISLELDIPSKELYEVLIEDYTNAEDTLVEFLFTNENIIQIKECVRESLQKYYNVIKDHTDEKESLIKRK